MRRLPHLPEHAGAWFSTIKPISDTALAELATARDNPESIITSQCPVRAIREITEDGQDLYLGDIGFTRCLDGKVLAPLDVEIEVEKAYGEENAHRVMGDPDIVWTIGDYLKPSHHGRGIMTDAVGTILDKWAIPRMNARKFLVTTIESNRASLRVFEKNGFRLIRTRKNHVEARGQIHDLHILELNIESTRGTTQIC